MKYHTSALRSSFILTALVVGLSLFASAPQERLLQLLQRAESEVRSGDQWAKLMMQADDEAAKLARPVTKQSPNYRSEMAGESSLTFKANGISGIEDYQHDLLKLVVVYQPGTSNGAIALNRLLQAECGLLGNEFTPYYRTVLDIVTQPSWAKLNDKGLTKIRAEAYETWWSLAQETSIQAKADGLNPNDYKEGSSDALRSAMAAYQQLIRINPADTEAFKHLTMLKAGQDTNQRNWFCVGD